MKGTVIRWPPRLPADPAGLEHALSLDGDGALLVRTAVTWQRQYVQAGANIIAVPCIVRDIRVQALSTGNRYVQVWDLAAPPAAATPVQDAPTYCGSNVTVAGSPVIDYGPEGRVFAIGCVVTFSSTITTYTPALSEFATSVRWRPHA